MSVYLLGVKVVRRETELQAKQMQSSSVPLVPSQEREARHKCKFCQDQRGIKAVAQPNIVR
jgi:hypothetical protein